MNRECAALTFALICPACSLMLDFSDSAAPVDAAIDTPFTPAACAYEEPNDALATAAMIAASDRGPAAICPANPEDHDFYRVTVTNPAQVTIAIHMMNRPGGDLDLKLYDPQGSLLAQSRQFSDDEIISCPGSTPPCTALAAGDYIFEVFPAVTGSVNEYTFSIAM